MNRIGQFFKVSFDEYCKAREAQGHCGCVETYEGIQLPTRATTGSAGYDFKAPVGFTLEPGESIKIPTGIRVKIADGWMLACFPRSGLGFKYRVQLDNTVGIIDSDYFNSDNEGHIFAKITNDSKENKTVHIKRGEAFMQGIFIPYGITYDDAASGVRNGGLGSTRVPNIIEFAQKQAA